MESSRVNRRIIFGFLFSLIVSYPSVNDYLALIYSNLPHSDVSFVTFRPQFFLRLRDYQSVH
jgi:hypothetical protein